MLLVVVMRMVGSYCIISLSVLSQLSMMCLYFGNKEKHYCCKFTEMVNLFSLYSFNFC